MKKHKAAGPDEIPTEFYKWVDDDNLASLLEILNQWWSLGTFSNDRLEAHTASIYKKKTTQIRGTTDLSLALTLSTKSMPHSYKSESPPQSTGSVWKPNSASVNQKALWFHLHAYAESVSALRRLMRKSIFCFGLGQGLWQNSSWPALLGFGQIGLSKTVYWRHKIPIYQPTICCQNTRQREQMAYPT